MTDGAIFADASSTLLSCERSETSCLERGVSEKNCPNLRGRSDAGGADDPQSLCVKVRPQFLIRYVLACLPENSSQGAGIELHVTRNRLDLFLSMRANAPQLDVAACLGMNYETKAFQDLNDRGS